MSDPTREEAVAYRAAAGSTLVDLVRAVAARVLVVFADATHLATRSGDTAAPAVYIGDLPPKSGADSDRFPWAIVRLFASTDTEESGVQMAQAVVGVEIGTYSDDAEGVLDLVALCDRVRLSLLGEPILNGTAFEHVGPLSVDIPEQQPRPQWLGAITTIWRLPRPARIEARDPTTEA